jgi:PAS domain S-box-containing protein
MADRPAFALLLVNGEEAQLQTVTRLLRDSGMTVVEAPAGTDSLNPREDLPNLVVLNGSSPSLENHVDEQVRQLVRANEELRRQIAEREEAEQALRQSETRLRLVIEASQDAFWDWDPKTDVAFWSHRFAELLGLPIGRVESITDLFRERIHPEDLQRCKEVFYHHIEGRGPYDLEVRLRRGDGTYGFFHLRGLAVCDESGQPIRMVGRLTDISERKRVEQELEENRRFLQRVADTLPAILYVYDRATQRCLYINREVTVVLGYNPAEIQEMGTEVLPRLLHPDDLAYLASAPSPLVSRPDTYVYPLELRMKHKNGTWRWIHSRNAVFTRDADGRPVQTIGTVLDITERKQSEEERERLLLQIEIERAHQNAVLRLLPVGVILAEAPSGKILLQNERAEQILRYVLGDAVPLTSSRHYQGFHADGRPFEPKDWPLTRAILEGEVVVEEEMGLRRADGSFGTLLANAAPIRDREGRLVAGLVTFQDISERKQLEAQLLQAQKMEAVGRLAGGVAHDFNNLLTVITGYADLLLGGRLVDQAGVGYVHEIRRSAERAADLTSQLLAFSRKQMQRLKVFDLNGLVANVVKMLSRLIGEDVRLEVRLGPEPSLIQADPTQIEQVLLNLVVNARDAMPNGGQITLAVHNTELDDSPARQRAEVPPGPYVQLTVRDTGTGMTDQVKAHLFEPFFTTKEVGKGTGLGLSTVYGIIKQSLGHIEVDSQPGSGTTFQIYLPRRPDGDPAEAPSRLEDQQPGGVETILLVEDDDAVRTLIVTILRERGYRVLLARHGAEGLRCAAQHPGPIHLLVTDVVMPDMNGRELADQLGRQRPGLKRLFLSGYTEDAIVRHDLSEPDFAFLQKPFKPEVLARKVHDCLHSSDPPIQ